MLKVKMLDAKGDSLLRDELHSLFATDMKHVPYRRMIDVQRDGVVHLHVPEGPVILNAKITIPGYGFMWVTADNCGQGYGLDAELEFIYEAAVSRVHEVEELLAGGNFTPSVDCVSRLDDAKTLLQLAKTSPKASEYHITALANALWAGERAVVDRARARIQGRRAEFLFGCGGFNYPYEEFPWAQGLYDQIFNYATLPFYLSWTEPEKGKPRYEQVDKLLDAFEKKGVVTKGHPLWWAHPQHGMPPWAHELKWEDGSVARELDRVVKRSVERYKGRIEMFDAINEAHDWCNGWNMTQDELVEMTRMCCDAIHEANAKAKAVINTCFMFGENAADGRVQWGIQNERNMTPYSYMEKVQALGFQYEVIGIQLYLPSRDMLAIDKLYDRFAVFGKPLHLTELGVPSHKADIPYPSHEGDVYCLRYMYSGLWREFEWSERLQADWLQDFYTISYAHPSVEALTWWSYTDPSYIPGAGLLQADGTPKEALFRLRALEKSWGYQFPLK